jgi:hypothetical protein
LVNRSGHPLADNVARKTFATNACSCGKALTGINRLPGHVRRTRRQRADSAGSAQDYRLAPADRNESRGSHLRAQPLGARDHLGIDRCLMMGVRIGASYRLYRP